MKYDLVLFDADDTLLDFEKAEEQALMDLFQHYGLSYDECAGDYRRINNACWAAFERGEMTQSVLRRERFERFCACRLPMENPPSVAAFYEHALSTKNDMLCGASETVKAISGKLPIVIVTNGIASIQRPRITSSPIFQYISDLLISEETGHQKPDPGMLYMAIEKFGTAKARTLMIGDSLTSDMRAAQAAGVDFLWYNPKGKTPPDNAFITYETNNISKFPQYALAE